MVHANRWVMAVAIGCACGPTGSTDSGDTDAGIVVGPDGELCSDERPLFQCAPGIACLSIVVCDPADPDVWMVVGDCDELPAGLRPCALPGVIDPFAVPAC